jgi:hypothetical protein
MKAKYKTRAREKTFQWMGSDVSERLLLDNSIAHEAAPYDTAQFSEAAKLLKVWR